jgi:hypothetical protein
MTVTTFIHFFFLFGSGTVQKSWVSKFLASRFIFQGFLFFFFCSISFVYSFSLDTTLI